MLDAARRADRTLMAAHPLRFTAHYLAIEALLRSGTLGAPRNLLMTRCALRPQRPSGWLFQNEAGGGVILDLQVHDLDVLLWLFGMPDRVTCAAQPLPGTDVIGAATAAFQYADGRMAQAYAEWLPVFNHHIGRTLRLNCEKGYAYFDLQRGLFATVYEDGTQHTRTDCLEMDGYLEEIRYFVDCVAHGRPCARCLPEDSLRTVALAHKVLQAAKR
jgi:predicted dehydrogenase